MRQKKSAPGAKTRGTSQTTTTSTATTTEASTVNSSHGTDTLVDLKLVGGVNADLWALLFDGKFRLAVQCDVCGRWLTSGASKAAGRGPNCAARAVK